MGNFPSVYEYPQGAMKYMELHWAKDEKNLALTKGKIMTSIVCYGNPLFKKKNALPSSLQIIRKMNYMFKEQLLITMFIKKIK